MHWTYERFSAADDLAQGDILEPTAELSEVFRTVHPHFSSPKYTGFLVLTQTCDLVCRGAPLKPKAKYIQICSIRPLEQIKGKLFSEVETPLYENGFKQGSRRKLEDFMSKLCNQNEQSKGLFFLYRDLDGIKSDKDGVAFLRVSVSLRQEHEPILRKARIGRLCPEFRAKLGWLVGNLFDRPATRDWDEEQPKHDVLDDESKSPLNLIISEAMGSGIDWVSNKAIEYAKGQKVEITESNAREIEKKVAPPDKRLLAIDRVSEILIEIASEKNGAISVEEIETVKGRITNDRRFEKCFK